MKKAIFGFLFIVTLSIFGYQYVFKAPQNVRKATSEFTIDASLFSKEFTDDLQKAEKKYIHKIFTVEGEITDIEEDGIILNNSVYCKFDQKFQSNLNEKIKVKGKYIGYDELFEVIKLDQCSIVK